MMNNITRFLNSSDNSNPSYIDYNLLDRAICYGVIGALALFSNVLLSVVFLRNRQMLEKAYNVIIFTLAVVDTLTGALMIGHASILLLSLQKGKSWFRMFPNTTVMTFGKMSVLLVLSLALDRWFAVIQPIRYRYNFTTRRVFLYVVVIPTIAASCNIPSTLLEGTIMETYFEITELTLMVFIPVLLTWIIFIHIWVHSKTSPAMQNAAGGKMKTKLLRMCAVTAIFLTINWFPTQLNHLIDLIQMNETTSTPLIMIAMANSCVNPWVYYFTNQEYKKEFHKILPCFAIKCKSNASSPFKIWSRKNTGNVAREDEKSAAVILRMQNLDQLTMPT